MKLPFRDRPEKAKVKTPEDRMTLTEHLAELRTRIIRCALAVAVGTVIVLAFYDKVLDFMLEPYQDLCRAEPEKFQDCNLQFIGPLEGFATRLSISTWGGVILALPVIMWQIWRFVVPALHSREKKYAIPFILSAVVLFVLGAVFAWYTVEKALQFLLYGSVGGEIQPAVTADKYLTLVTLMILAFGVSFEFPLLLIFLLLAGVLDTRTLRQYRRWAVVGITSFAAIITPSADPISLLFLAIPLYIFYELVIVIGRVMKK